MRRLSAAIVTAAALGVATIALADSPAWAAEGLKVQIDDPVLQGKVGDQVSLGFGVLNLSEKTAVKGVVVTVQAPANAVITQASAGCEIRGGRSAVCTDAGELGPHKVVKGQVTLSIKAGGTQVGRVSARDLTQQDQADFELRAAAAGPTPSASVTATKKPTATPTATPTGKTSTDPSAVPSLGSDTLAPPQTGNGVIIQSDDATAGKGGSGGGGSSFGLWVGIAAVVAALGLVGSLFYFRRKDKLEPDTGMHPVVPAPAGYPPPAPAGYPAPAAGGYDPFPPSSYDPYQPPPPAATTYGAPTEIINPVAPPPGGSDPTVTFRRPENNF